MELRKVTTWTAVIVLSVVIGGAAVLGIDSLHSGKSSSSTTPAVIEHAVQSPSSNISNTAPQSVADLYAQVRPSVVEIAGSSTRGGFGGGSSGLGSGIVLDNKGDILTNYHVVQGFNQLDVTFGDGTSVPGKVIGTDPGDDLAVVQVSVDPNELKPAVLGDSDKVRPGDAVMAVGNPFGIDGSVTEGIVSGLGRQLQGTNGARPLRQLIQSDAAINPGNSGGALFDMNGQVVGITNAIENPSGESVFVGIGYAIPINIAHKYLPDMLSGKPIQHARLGVALQNLTPSLAQQLGINVTQGVLITSVDSGSAAAKAGLHGGTGTSSRSGTVGDVVTAIDGNQVKNYDDLANYIDSKKVGDKVQLKIVRDNKEQTVDLTLDAWESSGA